MAPSEPKRRGLRYQKLSEEIADVLQRMILDGELASGQKVTQEELAGMLGVSTMPIREALLKLAAEGLIEASPNRSFHVVQMTIEDIRDSYWMHATLEGELTRRACQNRGRELVADLRRHEAAYEEAARSGSEVGLREENIAFHRAINQAAESPLLLFLLRATLRFSREGWYPRIEGWVPMSIEAHKQIIAAFEVDAADAAGAAAARHVSDAGALLVDYFRNTGRWAKGTTPSSSPVVSS